MEDWNQSGKGRRRRTRWTKHKFKSIITGRQELEKSITNQSDQKRRKNGLQKHESTSSIYSKKKNHMCFDQNSNKKEVMKNRITARRLKYVNFYVFLYIQALLLSLWCIFRGRAKQQVIKEKKLKAKMCCRPIFED